MLKAKYTKNLKKKNKDKAFFKISCPKSSATLYLNFAVIFYLNIKNFISQNFLIASFARSSSQYPSLVKTRLLSTKLATTQIICKLEKFICFSPIEFTFTRNGFQSDFRGPGHQFMYPSSSLTYITGPFFSNIWKLQQKEMLKNYLLQN